MNKKFLIIFLIIQFLVIISCKAQNIYKNDEVGFSFKVPKGSFLGNEDKGLNNYYIRIYIDKPEDLLDGVEQFNKIKENIENEKYPNIPNIPTLLLKYKKINNIKIGIDFHRGYDIYDSVFGKRIFFIKNNKLVTIYLQYEFSKPKDINDKNYLKFRFQEIEKKYREKAKENGITSNVGTYVINEIEGYIQKNKNKKTEMPDEVVKLFILFDELLSSLKFY